MHDHGNHQLLEVYSEGSESKLIIFHGMRNMDNCSVLKEENSKNELGELCAPKSQSMLQKDGPSKPNKSKRETPLEMILKPDQKWALTTSDPISRSTRSLRHTKYNAMVSIINREETPSSSESESQPDSLDVPNLEADPMEDPYLASAQFEEGGQATLEECWK